MIKDENGGDLSEEEYKLQYCKNCIPKLQKVRAQRNELKITVSVLEVRVDVLTADNEKLTGRVQKLTGRVEMLTKEHLIRGTIFFPW